MASPPLLYALSDLDWLHWGVIVSTVFSGIIVMQGWIYFNNNNDGWHLRLFIAALIMLDFVTTCLNSLILRHDSLANFGTPQALIQTAAIIDAQVIVTSVVVFMVQLFLASRIYLLDKSFWYPPAAIIACATGALVSMLLLVVYNYRHDLVLPSLSTQMRIEMAISSGLAASADLVATIALCWKLSAANTGSGVIRIQTVFHRLFMYFITRGILLTLNQFVNVIVYETQPVSLHWMPIQLIQCKLYVNTTLTILNTRTSLRTQLDADAIDSSKRMNPIYFAAHPASQPDVEARTFTVREQKILVNRGIQV